MRKPLVSVIIATYNRAALLQEALASIFGQLGIGIDFDLEVIAVDDASTDLTSQVTKRFSPLRYIKLDSNVGLPAARNVGIRASTGEYIAFLDDDDLWLPHKLRIQIPVLERDPTSAVVYSQLIVQEGGRDSLWPSPDLAPSGMILQNLLLDCLAGPGSVLVRRTAFDKAGYFDEQLRTNDDYDMWLRLAVHVRFTFVPQPVAVYRRTLDGKFATAAKKGYLGATLHHIVDKALATLPPTPDSATLCRKARAYIFLQVASQLAAVGNIDPIQSNLLAALRHAPELIFDHRAQSTIQRHARRMALSSATPIRLLQGFCTEFRSIIDSRSLKKRLVVTRILGKIWAEVAYGLAVASPPRLTDASSAAAKALQYDPFSVVRWTWWILTRRRISQPSGPMLRTQRQLAWPNE